MQQIVEGIACGLIIISRVMSHFEHKKTSRDVTEIKISINGELDRRLAEAKEQGRQEEIEKQKNKSL